ncbi:PKD domain-containing protein [Olleya aquimaris]|uniref:PKD domain-containing protein n=1 Tax=Olleya sediminilitoris TaxID=2795739 RepID=A0ABS1WHP9_9FLAO|nr:PKD domain-containing protein [Olleya sediminilitoris]AXO79593.1 PKD domain-containing protein [Olleya aquimaris]MBL7558639.1 PKD domain-containing protein [Olleya sediminilitoris]
MSEKNITHYHMDKMVKYLFIFVFLISASVLGYHYNNQSGCNIVVFETEAQNFTVKEAIIFNDKTIDAEKWQWDFGDNTSSFQKNPAHYFEKPGSYDVQLIVNGKCTAIQTVQINEAIKIVDSTKFPVFNLPESIRAGEKLVLNDETENASAWEWRFGESPNVDDNNKIASYVYKEPGLYTIKLVVNNEYDYISKKKIKVLEPEKGVSILDQELPSVKPIKNWNVKDYPIGYKSGDDEDKPEDVKPMTAPNITDKNFSRMLIQVSNGTKTALDFKMYFCGDINKTVVVNKSTMSFSVLCQKIANKNIKIKSLELDKQKGTNCIENVSLIYKRTIF